MKEKKNVGLNFILSGWGWGGRLTQNLEKSKKKIQNTLSIFKIYYKFYYCYEKGGGGYCSKLIFC